MFRTGMPGVRAFDIDVLGDGTSSRADEVEEQRRRSTRSSRPGSDDLAPELRCGDVGPPSADDLMPTASWKRHWRH